MKFQKYIKQKDLVVIGAGLPGIVAAIQAARLGLRVALINDRGYLGGNASAEINVQVNGADASMEFNFFARETGIIEEIRLENLFRNPQSNRYIWDTVLLDFVLQEENIELFLNTNIDSVNVDENKNIISVDGSQLDSEKRFVFEAKWFLDDTGDGTIGALAGADYMQGREAKDTFDERIAPDHADHYVIPSTLNFYAKDVGKPVHYVPPKFAVDLKKGDILKYRTIPQNGFERSQWFYELGGSYDQVADIETIIHMHRGLVYGIWDYIKNSGNYPSENYDLEYVSCIPGKRESRRLVGDYILTEKDVVEQKDFEDAVGYGGWSIDLHAIDGFYSKDIINRHFVLKGIYQIPFRTGYSKDIKNLFMAGRCMSTSHVAFGSTRVIATLSTLGQALGAAAYLCKKYCIMPSEVYTKGYVKELQQLLLRNDCYIPGVCQEIKGTKMEQAIISASSTKKCCCVHSDSELILEKKVGLILPVKEYLGKVKLLIRNTKSTELRYSVYLPHKKESYNPAYKIQEGKIELDNIKEFQWITVEINKEINNQYVFIMLEENPDIVIAASSKLMQGCVSLMRYPNTAPNVVDIDTLEKKEFCWRKIEGSICFALSHDENTYNPNNVINGWRRPHGNANLWVSDGKCKDEWLAASFIKPTSINEMKICFDSNLNQMLDWSWHEKNTMPQIVKDYDVYCKINGKYQKIQEIRNNYQRMNKISVNKKNVEEIKIRFLSTNGADEVGVYAWDIC